MNKNNDKYIKHLEEDLAERDKEYYDMLDRLWESNKKCAKLEGELSLLREIFKIDKVEDTKFVVFGGRIFKITGFTEKVDKGEHELTVTAEKVV